MKTIKFFLKLLTFVLLVLIFVSGCISQREMPQFELQRVVRVVDGDTIILENKEKVRLIGINAPEKGTHCYNEAKQKLAELVLGKEVRLEKDKSNRDKYGRLLRYVFVKEEFINLEMVKSGFARSFPYEPDTKFVEEFEIAEQKAKLENGCIWQN